MKMIMSCLFAVLLANATENNNNIPLSFSKEIVAEWESQSPNVQHLIAGLTVKYLSVHHV